MAKDTDCDKCKALQAVTKGRTCSKHGNINPTKTKVQHHGAKSVDRGSNSSYRTSSKRKSGEE